MTLPVQEPIDFPTFNYIEEIEEPGATLNSAFPGGNGDEEPDEDDDFEENYGDLEDGHDDLNEPESDRGVDNLE